MSITVKIQFNNNKNCGYSIILTLRSIAMCPCAFEPPLFKNSGSIPAQGQIRCVFNTVIHVGNTVSAKDSIKYYIGAILDCELNLKY